MLLSSSKSKTDLVLGWPANEVKMVQRIASGFTDGQDSRLLYHEFARGPIGSIVLKRILDVVSTFTCQRCVSYLIYIFGAGTDEILIGSLPTTPQSFIHSLSAAAKLSADSVGPIEFVGGPPGKVKRYTGTFVTLLQDYILNAVATNNTKQLIKIRDAKLIN